MAIVGQIKLVNPPAASLERGADGLYRQRNGQPAPVDTNVQVTSGALEGSNVRAVEMLVQMIRHARQFETKVQVLTIANTNAQMDRVLNLSA